MKTVSDVSPFRAALKALSRALANASGPDPAVEQIVAAATRLSELAIPGDWKQVFRQIATAFKTSDSPERSQRLLERAHTRIHELLDPAFAPQLMKRPLTVFPGVGPKRAALLESRGIASIEDLLFHFPSDYDDRRSLQNLGDIEVGQRITFIGEVLSAEFRPARSRGGRFRRIFEIEAGDGHGQIVLRWFHGGDSISDLLPVGASILVTGDVKRQRFSKVIFHPEVERLQDASESQQPESEHEAVAPIYSAPEGVHPRALRRLIQRAVGEYADLLEGWLPPEWAKERDLPTPASAMLTLHQPGNDVDLEALRSGSDPARVRLVLEELFLLELGLLMRKEKKREQAGIALEVSQDDLQHMLHELPFELTGAQARALSEIANDLSQGSPMHRLLQGDVGSGKTAVAFVAARIAVAKGAQAALMAPTELLAEQHARTLAKLAKQVVPSLRIALLTSSLGKSDQRAVRRALALGHVDIVVGTHALVQEEVRFARLGLAVIDEQHRFGVLQRAALGKNQKEQLPPHVLVMTATPIPRSLALTLYGDLDLSVIDELPPGRSPVATSVLREGEGQQAVDQVRETVARGEQVYVVYPLVEESEQLDLRAATESAEKIRATFPECKIELVHGRLDQQARNEAMGRFERGESQILVSTTVIEVGVDVPNATLMIIEHAERFGLAQLHQLRGRVGRGERPGQCLLLARGGSPDSEARLRAMVRTTDGFQIADADLRIRGPGEFLGTRQSGRLPDLRIANLIRDARFVAEARHLAQESLREDPLLQNSPDLLQRVLERWGERLELAGVG